MTALRVHFWTRRPEALVAWDPDAQPQMHSSAYGHAFLELYSRLTSAGRHVSIGPHVAKGSSLVVVSLEELAEWQPRVPARMAAHLALAVLKTARTPGVAVLRVDAALFVEVPAYVCLEIMPTKASIDRSRQVWLPMLPQRGMLRRNPDRGDRLETVALKAFSYNVPTWMDEDFAKRLTRLGFRLRIDDEHSGRWNDFHDVDIVLCTHKTETLEDEKRKPATKLINAWQAGVIPVCGDYVGYHELAIHEQTALFVAGEDAEEYVAVLTRLRDDPQLAEQIRGMMPTERYSPTAVTQRYWDAFEKVQPARRAVVAWAAVTTLAREARRRIRVSPLPWHRFSRGSRRC